MADTVNGTSGNDIIDAAWLGRTPANDEIINGLDGDDHLFGLGGNDTLAGGDGDDILHGGLGADALRGSAGTDFADYSTAAAGLTVSLASPASNTEEAAGDTFTSIEGLVGSSFDDMLFGNSSANVLRGGLGADTLNGGAGDDFADYRNAAAGVTASLDTPSSNTGEAAGDSYFLIEGLSGSNFDDTLIGDGEDNVLRGGLGADTLTGGAGIDTADYLLAATGVTASLTAPAGNTGEAEGDVYAAIEDLRGSAFDDVLTGDGLANALTGGDGNDTFQGMAGADTVSGDDGVDTAVYADKTLAVVVTLLSSAYATVTVGGVAEDRIRRIENVTGGTAADTLTGNSSANTLQGLGGNDTLDGGTGSDTASWADKTQAVAMTLNGAANASVTVGGVAEDTVRNIENAVGGAGGDSLTGDGLVNTLEGGAGADTLNGGVGNDTLSGGSGNDSLDGGDGIDAASYADKTVAVAATLNGASDAIVTIGGIAEDIVRNIENLIGGSTGDTFTGDALVNILNGGGGNDVLRGGDSVDTLDGDVGQDTALFSDKTAAVAVTLNGASTVTVTVGGVADDRLRNVENVTGGTANDTLSGDSLANTLVGGSGDDTLRGNAGADLLIGASGVDVAIYTEKTAAVAVTLNGATSATVTVGGVAEDILRTVENVVGGSGNDTLNGDALANALDGGAGTDTLDGGGGDDRLAGGSDDDVLAGGLGNDTFIGGPGNDTLDGNAGLDTASYADLFVSVAVTLNGAGNASVSIGGVAQDTVRNIENVTGGAAGDTLSGDAFANTLTGGGGTDALRGNAGADVLDGGNNGDVGDSAFYTEKTQAVVVTLNGAADATVIVGGVAEDTLRNIENVISGSGDDTLRGDTSHNLLQGGAGNDTLGNPGFNTIARSDSLDGGSGVDTADFSNLAVAITATLAGAADAFISAAHSLVRNIENLIGGTANDVLTGDGLSNLLAGGAGDDSLKGVLGSDVLDGGIGSDTALYDDKTVAVAVTLNGAANATVTVGGLAEDTIRNIEIVIGGSGNDRFTGDALSNTLQGEAGDDSLSGGSGNDTLKGDDVVRGADTMDGGAGIDTADFGRTVLSVVVTLNGAANVIATVGGVAEDTLRSIENVIGSFGNDILSGDALANTLAGNAGDDTLKGSAGADVLDGGAGVLGGLDSDTALYTEKTAAVVVSLNGGSDAVVTVGGVAEDTIRNIENVTGGSAADTLTGDGLANAFRGMAGNDSLNGGAGLDSALYTEKSGAVVVTLNGSANAIVTVGGVAEDTIRSIENVTGGSGSDSLTGDGLANVFQGADGNDVLNGRTGNDALTGGVGADTLDGGAGADAAIYSENTSSVSVTLNGAANATVTVGGVAEDIIRNIENVTGGAGNDSLTGDGLANVLQGGNGNDLLVGGAGNDTMIAGLGADTLDGGAGLEAVGYGDRTTAVAVTLNGANNAVVTVGGVAEDTIRSIENVTGGSAADSLTGDVLANVLEGGGAADNLIGGAGDDILNGYVTSPGILVADGVDTLDGGAGSDQFLFNTFGFDVVANFAPVEDTILLENAFFTALAATGPLAPAAFHIGTAAHDADDRIIYNPATGDLLYDADGTGFNFAQKFAQLAPGLALTAADFNVV